MPTRARPESGPERPDAASSPHGPSFDIESQEGEEIVNVARDVNIFRGPPPAPPPGPAPPLVTALVVLAGIAMLGGMVLSIVSIIWQSRDFPSTELLRLAGVPAMTLGIGLFSAGVILLTVAGVVNGAVKARGRSRRDEAG